MAIFQPAILVYWRVQYIVGGSARRILGVAKLQSRRAERRHNNLQCLTEMALNSYKNLGGSPQLVSG